jgi:hypothetical protein
VQVVPIFNVGTIIVAVVIPVDLRITGDLALAVSVKGSLCVADRKLSASLVPEAGVRITASATAYLLVVEGGVCLSVVLSQLCTVWPHHDCCFRRTVCVWVSAQAYIRAWFLVLVYCCSFLLHL